jgi:hypothetical protein
MLLSRAVGTGAQYGLYLSNIVGAFYTANVSIVSSCPDKAAAVDSEADSVCATGDPSVEEERTIQ